MDSSPPTSTPALGRAIAHSNRAGFVLIMVKLACGHSAHLTWTKCEYGAELERNEELPALKIMEAARAPRDSELYVTWGPPTDEQESEWSWLPWLAKSVGQRIWKNGMSIHTTGMRQSTQLVRARPSLPPPYTLFLDCNALRPLVSLCELARASRDMDILRW